MIRLVLLIVLLLFVIYYMPTQGKDSYRIGGGNWVPERNDYLPTPCLQTGAGGLGAINSCERNSYTEKTKLYHDNTVANDCGDDKGMHFRRVAYVGWDTPIVTKDFCRGWG